MPHAHRAFEASDFQDLSDSVILPSQYFGAMGGTGGLSSEQRLMFAVLVDAINILLGWNRMDTARKRRAFAEASQWVIMKGTNCPFSFDSVCDALNIESQMLRERLRAIEMGKHRNTERLGPGRLRLGELPRAQTITVNRVRHRC
jgi:hypothetical protein